MSASRTLLTHDLSEISFGKSFFDPVMILGVPSFEGEDHGHPRIARLDSQGATLWFDESDNCDGDVSHPESVAWAVFERGVSFSGQLQTGTLAISSDDYA